MAGEEEPAIRVRAPGGARKSLAESDPGLLLQLGAFVDPETRVDPMSLLVWTTKSTRNPADALTKLGHRVSDRTVARMLIDALPLTRHDFHGDWNYRITPPDTP